MSYKFSSGSIRCNDIYYDQVTGAADMYIKFAIAPPMGERSITLTPSGTATMKVTDGQVTITNVTATPPTNLDSQLVLGYNNTNYAYLGVDSNGGLGITTVDSDGTLADIVLNPNGQINFFHNQVTALGNDGGQGDFVFYGGGTTVVGKLFYLHSGSSNWLATDADILESGSNQQLGITPTTAPGGGVVIRGFYDVDAFLTGAFSPGQPVYVGRAAGYITTMRPSGSGNFVRQIGHCTTTAKVIYFNPSNEWIELS